MSLLVHTDWLKILQLEGGHMEVWNFGSLYLTWFGQEMKFVVSEICYKRVRYIEVLLYLGPIKIV